MPDTSPELNLALAVGGDDTAAYLRNTSSSLRASLLVLDGLFNASTGHTHSGAHQGGALSFQNLTVGANLVVNGTSDQHGISHFYNTLTVDGALSLGSNLTVAGGTSVQGLTVAGSETIGGSLAVTQGITAAQVTAGPALNGGTGDLSANRGNGTGYVMLGQISRYMGFDGSSYQMASAPLNVGGLIYALGDRVVTEVAGQTLSNKTLNSPSIGGVAGWTAAQSFVAPSKQNGLNLLALSNATDWVMDYGTTGLISTPNGGVANQAVSFNRAFTVAPYVLVSVAFFSGTIASIQSINCIAHNVTTSGFQLDLGNASGSSQGIMVSWIAIGR